MKRREFISLIGGGAVAWPLAARAQQPSMPLIGWLAHNPLELGRENIAAFRQGLAESGYIEGRNVTIEYRSAESDAARLSSIARELVSHRVSIIAGVSTTAAAFAAKAASTAIPIVFCIGGDPVKNGLVASFNRPGGNLTGVSFMFNELGPKRMGLLRDVVFKRH